MPDNTQVTAAEIARMAGVGRAAVSNWRRRYPDFPEPVAGAGAGPEFRLDEVNQWLRRQGKLSRTHAADELWRRLDAGRDDAELIDLVADIAFWLREPSSVELPDGLADDLSAVDPQSPQELIESLLALLFQRQQRQHLVTPPELSRLMVELAGPMSGTVLDPACGAGNILAEAAEAGAQQLCGQEIDGGLARLVRARLGGVAPATVSAGDALLGDAFDGTRADAVLCDPPFGLRNWGHEELGVDPRWEYGFPPKGEPELAWAQHGLAHANPGAPVVLAMPSSAAARRSGRAIRQALLRGGAVRAVIALPAGLLMSTGIPIHLWVLRRPDSAGVEPVLMVDATHHRPRRRGHADWSAIDEEVLEAWREFQANGAVEEIPGRRRVIEAIELLDEEVDFTPARHLPQPPKTLDLGVIQETKERLLTAVAALEERIPEVAEVEPASRTATTIQDLARAGVLEVRSQTKPLETDENAGGPWVLTGRDVATGRDPADRLVDGVEAEPLRLRAGDVVVPLLLAGEGTISARVIETDDWVLGPNLQLLRVDDDQLDRWFLAGQLRSTAAGQAGSATASGVHRIEVRRIEIPVLELAEQRRLGTAFRRLTRLEADLSEAASLGASLSRDLLDGLAEGTVRPAE